MMPFGSGRLPDNRDALVLVVEAEKDVQAAWSIGAVAVSQSIFTFASADWSVLAGRPVLVVAAGNEPSRQWARAVAENIVSIAARVTIGEAADGMNLSDHVAIGHDIGDLIFVDELRPAQRLVLTRASEIADAGPRWAWRYAGEGRIPSGSLVLAAGRPGVGKSSFACRLAADMSNGSLEGDFFGIGRAVIVCAVEDSWRYTFVPRLRASGANLDNVYRVEVANPERRSGQFLPVIDPVELERVAAQVDAALIVIDPMVSSIDIDRDKIDLLPYSLLAERLGAVVLGICHMTLSSREVVTAIGEGSALAEHARASFGFLTDAGPERCPRILVQAKNAHGLEDLAVTYDISSSVDGRVGGGTFIITGQSPVAVHDIVNDVGSPVVPTTDARTWLEGYLRLHGVVRSSEVKEAGARHGYSRSTIDRAARKLNVVSEAKGFPRVTYWRFPDTR